MENKSRKIRVLLGGDVRKSRNKNLFDGKLPENILHFL